MSSAQKIPDYKVFISYRHLSPDQHIAKALHKLLEYNLVRPNRKVPRNIRPVCMDIMEFPLEADLDDGICKSLEHSDFLVVICSPNLPKSKYCMREIAYFKQLHGGSLDRIRTLLVDGTPEESFPDILRTSAKTITDPDGTQRTVQVEVEPLFADVRGKTLYHSLWKLVASEYLRLVAAYFGCSYDALKQRRKWDLFKLGAVAAALVMALGFGFQRYSQARDTQFQTAQAQSAASYALEQLQQQDELLAMTLLTSVEPAESDYYTAALRSAVVQHDYKKHGSPVAPVLQVPYEFGGNTVCYQSSTGQQILMYDDFMVKIIDAKTGAVSLNAAKDKFVIPGDQPDRYFILHSHEDEAGIMRDYVSLYNILDNSLIREFSFREADSSSPNYHLVYDPVKAPHLLAVQDGNSYVAFLTSEGVQLSREEFIRQAEQHLDTPTPVDDSTYRVTKNKFLSTWEVKDADGTVLLQLGKECSHSDFSDDWQYLAWSDRESIHIYETTTWKECATLPLFGSPLLCFHLLPHSTYLLAQYDRGQWDTTVLYDWQTGTQLLETPGFYEVSISEQAFFVTAGGILTRYDYTGMDLSRKSQVVGHFGKLSLSLQDGNCVLLDAEGSRLLQVPYDLSPAWDDTLSHILISRDGSLSCYGNSGQLLWQQPAEADTITLSPDGELAAWADSAGTVFVLDADSGTLRYDIPAQQSAEVGSIRRLALSRHGVCILGSEDTLWFSPGGNRTSLGPATNARLYRDGMLILENEYARFYDFQVYNISSQLELIYRPDDNTALWAYSPASGYLVRQLETGTLHPALEVAVLKLTGSQFEAVGTLTLPQSQADALLLDSSGQWLSVLCNGTQLYRMEDLVKQLDTDCLLYYEDGALYGMTACGSRQYSFAMQNTQQLHSCALEMLTGSTGTRQLSEEEKALYSIS